jgi:hypothetical protein
MIYLLVVVVVLQICTLLVALLAIAGLLAVEERLSSIKKRLNLPTSEDGE